jgi:hypothetical protein
MTDPLAPIFAALKKHYDETVKEPIPQRILDLVRKLK